MRFLVDAREGGLPKMRTNFTNAIAMLAVCIEEPIPECGGYGRRREPRGRPGSRGPGAAADWTLVSAPVKKTRRKIEKQTTPDRVI